MTRTVAAMASALAICAGFAAPVIAGPADTIRARIAGYRALGAAYKNTNDALRSDAPDGVAIRRAAATISTTAHHQYHWFPRGTGAESRQRTKARAEIWTNAPAFRTAQDAFAAQAAIFSRAAAARDMAAIRLEARKLGGTCKQCHDQFRVAND